MGVMSGNIHHHSMTITQHLHTWLLIEQREKSNWMFSCKSGLYLVAFPAGFCPHQLFKQINNYQRQALYLLHHKPP